MKFLKMFSFIPFLFSAKTVTAKPAQLEVGQSAPEVSSVDQEGNRVNFAEVYQNNKYVVVYFYPKADTPGCTAQACSLRDEFVQIQKRGITVYGVSNDSTKAQADFKKKYNLPFTLIADTDKKVIQAFGVPTTMGFASRQAFLIKDGKVVWLDRSASTTEQAKDILNAIE